VRVGFGVEGAWVRISVTFGLGFGFGLRVGWSYA